MIKIFFPFLVLVCLPTILFAQQWTVSGKVADERGNPLPGAHLTLLYPWDEEVKSTVSDEQGSFVLLEVEQGGYRLRASFVGYEELVGEVTLNSENLNVGTLRLNPTATSLREVQVVEKIPLATQDEDTTSFNADAFKVLKDASADELVEKMPGITLEDGKVQAQGEEVQQVLVDGRPFFGNDPSAALKNLPAEVIQKIQVYDQASDQAQFTGFDDGNSSKTINIVTRPNMRNGQFGKAYVGIGWEDKYQAGGNLNFFNGDQRISVIGLTNNVNVQNFATEDLLGVIEQSGRRGRGGMGSGGGGGRGRGRGGSGGGQGSSSVNDFLVSPKGGIATTHALGLNYSDEWGEKWEASASYFFNKSEVMAEAELNQQFLSDDGTGEDYMELTNSESDNVNHRINGRIKVEIDSSNSLIFRPQLSLQLNDGNSTAFGQTGLGQELLAQTTNDYVSDLMALNFSNSVYWRHKFSKEGRTFSLNVTSGFAPKKGESSLASNDAFFLQNSFDTIDQKTSLELNSWNASSHLNYTEPLGEKSQVIFEYRWSLQQEESDQEVLEFNETSQSFSDLNESLSNVFSNDYWTHRGGMGYSFRPHSNLRLMARARVQWAELENRQTYPQTSDSGQSFRNFLPMAVLRWNIAGRTKNLRTGFFTSTDLPTVEQLQNVVDNSNPLQLEIGNPSLKQVLAHRVFARYQSANAQKSTVFFAMFIAQFRKNHIGQATYFSETADELFPDLTLQPGAQISLPENFTGYRNLRSFVNYGFPLKMLQSNLNVDLTWNLIRTPGAVDGATNFSKRNTFSAGIVLSSNISNRMDFSLSVRPNFNRVRNTLQTGGNQDFLSQNSRFKLNWIVYNGFVIRTKLLHLMNQGLSDGFNQNYWLWSLGIGKKLFKSERGELSLAVNDLLDQNRNITRTVTETFIEDSRTNALTRYLMLSFTYDLRHFNSRNASPKK